MQGGTGYLSANIVLMHEELKCWPKWRGKCWLLRSIGFMPRIETINALEAWLGSHPGNGYADLRRPLINTMNMVDLLPLATDLDRAGTQSLSLLPTDSREKQK